VCCTTPFQSIVSFTETVQKAIAQSIFSTRPPRKKRCIHYIHPNSPKYIKIQGHTHMRWIESTLRTVVFTQWFIPFYTNLGMVYTTQFW
jgi:hypothetical protein